MKTAEQIYHNIETGVIDVSNEVMEAAWCDAVVEWCKGGTE